ncbi:MAG: S8 family serine peptidase [Caulobacteraceae bacterium]
MKLIKEMAKSIPISAYFKKIDPAFNSILSNKKIKNIPIIATFRKPLDNKSESKLKKLGFKAKYYFPFLNGVSGKIPVTAFESLSSILEIQKIYFDGKAYLMGEPAAVPTEKESPPAGSLFLSGKGVTVAFIDSGVYPHPDLVQPRNRIIAFKDFINDIEGPYDDNGHGTACIGAAFGASMDGKFKAAAYDAGIVCAKAFNHLSIGSFSDIIAAMQWIFSIKDKYNIKIIVLSFGTTCTHKDFDLMGHAASVLWQNGLFVSSCSGNLGPNEGSITSPGICSLSFTTGACDTTTLPPKVTEFSSRGPSAGKADKPDAVMPGYKVTGLSTDIRYVPKSKMIPHSHTLSQLYTDISGSSVSASHAAAAASLLYQKKGSLSPDDVKSILKACCISINELKTAQGGGIIDIKKIEEFE